jgi:hypothetical protein
MRTRRHSCAGAIFTSVPIGRVIWTPYGQWWPTVRETQVDWRQIHHFSVDYSVQDDKESARRGEGCHPRSIIRVSATEEMATNFHRAV